MTDNIKILIAGVGGQGIVYLTNFIVEAAMLSDIPVSVSEIHGLSRRGGVVTSGIGLGPYCTGFTGKAGVDILIGLEPLETQRCISYLHKKSSVIFGNYKVQPYSVNAQMAEYPDINEFVKYLELQCSEVVFIDHFPEELEPVHYNIFMLGRATRMKNFPIKAIKIEEALIGNLTGREKDRSLYAFNLGLDFDLIKKSTLNV